MSLLSSDPLLPATWRQTTSGGSYPATSPVPYRVVSRNGWFEAEEAEAFEKYIIPSDRLMDFVTESFPDPYVKTSIINGIPTIQTVYPFPRKMPPLPRFRTKKITWESHDEGRPVDPFGADPTAPDGTYCDRLIVDIDYTTEYGEDESDPENPQTYLELSAQASGEFIHTPTATARWESDNAKNKEIDTPATVTVPMTEWTVRWNRIPWSHFNGQLIGRLRELMGTVNESAMTLLYSAPAETVLFSGYSYSEQRSYHSGSNPGQPPITIEAKFLEKHVLTPDGTVVGHNHFWRPEKSKWDKLLINGGDPAYKLSDFNTMFS